MRSSVFLIGSLLIFFITGPLLAGQAKAAEVKKTKQAGMPEVKVTRGEGPVEIEADQLTYERDIQTYEAHGQVEVKRGDLSLKSDHAQLKMATKDLTAWGNVVLVEGEDVVECERLEVNLDSRAGKVYRARLFLKEQNFHVTGKEMEKLGESSYRIRDGSLTSCDAEHPPWKFTMEELDVTLKGRGIAKGPVVYLKDIPFLYLPLAVFPVNQDRQTGLLFPEAGYSSAHGFTFKDAFYWAIDKDMDATFYLSYYGDRGLKEGVEYRYAFANETRGQANFYFTNDQVLKENRYAFFFQHEQKLPEGFYLKGDINQVSDRFYPIDFHRDLPEKTEIDSTSLKQLRSVLFGGKNWDQFSFLAEGFFFRDLTKESNDETLQKLPQINFYAHPQPLLRTPFFYDLTSSYINFWRQQGVEAQRADLFPRLSYPVRLFDVLKFESDVGLRETAYQVHNDPTGQLQGWKSRETLEAGMSLSAEFYRLYEAAQFPWLSQFFKVSKWMHTIEPAISYSYSPRVNQSDLPQLDPVDRIPYTNQITYGITQRLVGKPTKEGTDSGPYEYARLQIFQSYSLGDPIIDPLTNTKGGKFSNIQAELSWYFNPYLTAQWDTGFNPYQKNFETMDARVRLKDQRDDAFVAQYRFTKENIKQLNLFARLTTIKPLSVYAATYYNLLEKRWVENLYGAEYQAQCWTLGVTVDDKNSSPDGTQKKELQFWVYLNLLGIGSVGHKPPYANM